LVTAYCDGAIHKQTEVGGVGGVIETPDELLVFFGMFAGSTSSRSELAAALTTLHHVNVLFPQHRKDKIVLMSDSMYVVRGATQWAPIWRMNKWRTTVDREEPSHVDLWKKILLLAAGLPHLSWHYVPGHSGVPGNELADFLAQQSKRIVNESYPYAGQVMTSGLLYGWDFTLKKAAFKAKEIEDGSLMKGIMERVEQVKWGDLGVKVL